VIRIRPPSLVCLCRCQRGGLPGPLYRNALPRNLCRTYSFEWLVSGFVPRRVAWPLRGGWSFRVMSVRCGVPGDSSSSLASSGVLALIRQRHSAGGTTSPYGFLRLGAAAFRRRGRRRMSRLWGVGPVARGGPATLAISMWGLRRLVCCCLHRSGRPACCACRGGSCAAGSLWLGFYGSGAACTVRAIGPPSCHAGLVRFPAEVPRCQGPLCRSRWFGMVRAGRLWTVVSLPVAFLGTCCVFPLPAFVPSPVLLPSTGCGVGSAGRQVLIVGWSWARPNVVGF